MQAPVPSRGGLTAAAAILRMKPEEQEKDAAAELERIKKCALERVST